MLVTRDDLRKVEYRDTLDFLYERRYWLRRQIQNAQRGIGFGPAFGKPSRAEAIAQLSVEYEEVEIRLTHRLNTLDSKSAHRLDYLDIQSASDHPFIPDPVRPLCTACDEPEVRHTATRAPAAREDER